MEVQSPDIGFAGHALRLEKDGLLLSPKERVPVPSRHEH